MIVRREKRAGFGGEGEIFSNRPGEGQAVERGTHEDLMYARGMYRDMVVRQMESHGYEGEEVLR